MHGLEPKNAEHDHDDPHGPVALAESTNGNIAREGDEVKSNSEQNRWPDEAAKQVPKCTRRRERKGPRCSHQGKQPENQKERPKTSLPMNLGKETNHGSSDDK